MNSSEFTFKASPLTLSCRVKVKEPNEVTLDQLDEANRKLSEVTEQLMQLIVKRRSVWKERRILEENFLLQKEARQQRLDQLTEMMKIDDFDSSRLEAQLAEPRIELVIHEKEAARQNRIDTSTLSDFETAYGGDFLTLSEPEGISCNDQFSSFFDAGINDIKRNEFETPLNRTFAVVGDFNNPESTPKEEPASPVNDDDRSSSDSNVLLLKLHKLVTAAYHHNVSIDGLDTAGSKAFWSEIFVKVSNVVNKKKQELSPGFHINLRDSGLSSWVCEATKLVGDNYQEATEWKNEPITKSLLTVSSTKPDSGPTAPSCG